MSNMLLPDFPASQQNISGAAPETLRTPPTTRLKLDMPVTVQINSHPAKPWPKPKSNTPEQLLETVSPRHYRRCQRLVQSSFNSPGLEAEYISGSNNGFVWAAFHAYSDHHHLVIRPEDIWFAILSQLSFYINAHAEELRSFFVAHDGRKELKAEADVADFGYLAMKMTDLIAKNVNDPELRDWVIPSFSTTTNDDKVIGAILFMGAMQKYFSYYMAVACGLPSVTLQGDVEDWKEIARRLDKIDQLGDEPKQFASMLRPVLKHFILTMEEPTNAAVKPFWNDIAHLNEEMSGTDWLSGWLMGFSFWTEKGAPNRLWPENCHFGDVLYPRVDIDMITAGSASVPVVVNDMGHEFSATMVAGSVGILAMDQLSHQRETDAAPRPQSSSATSAADGHEGDTNMDTIRAVSGWWMYEDEAKEAVQVRETEMQQLRKDLSTYWDELFSDDVKEERKQFLREARDRLDELEAF